MRTSCKYDVITVQLPLSSHGTTSIQSSSNLHAVTLHISCLYPASLYTQFVMSAYLRTYICDTCDLKALESRYARPTCSQRGRTTSVRRRVAASTYVNIRQNTRQHTSAYAEVSIRHHTCTTVRSCVHVTRFSCTVVSSTRSGCHVRGSQATYVSIRQHTSTYVSIHCCQHASA